jgi:hypothetical protein
MKRKVPTSEIRDSILNIVNKSSSSKKIFCNTKICSRRDMQTVEFGISKL